MATETSPTPIFWRTLLDYPPSLLSLTSVVKSSSHRHYSPFSDPSPTLSPLSEFLVKRRFFLLPPVLLYTCPCRTSSPIRSGPRTTTRLPSSFMACPESALFPLRVLFLLSYKRPPLPFCHPLRDILPKKGVTLFFTPINGFLFHTRAFRIAKLF